MKYVLLFVDSNRDEWDRMPEPEKTKIYARIGEWWGEHAGVGRILGGHELSAPAFLQVRRSAGAKETALGLSQPSGA